MARLRFFLAQAMLGLMRSPGVTALTVLSIGIALAFIAGFGIVIEGLAHLVENLGHEVELSAYLERDAEIAEKPESVLKQIEGWEGVRSVRFATSSQSMTEFRHSLGRDSVLLEGLPEDLLPPVIFVRLDERRWKAENVDQLATRLGEIAGVEDVRYGQEDIERIQTLLAFARTLTFVIGAILCVAVILLVSNTIRLAVYSRRDEIEIMSLIGATDLFVRAPFVIEGGVQGFVGGAVAAIGGVLCRGAIIDGLEKGLELAHGPLSGELASSGYFAWLMVLGGMLGLIGSLLAVGKFVRI